MKKILTHGELFAGISGFGLGFEKAGIKTKWMVEKDLNCQKVLRYHYPEIKLLSDVEKCGVHNLEPVDIISFGSPCQDMSVAGQRAGIQGERSGLFFEATRIIKEMRDKYGSPIFAIWENVPGAFSSNGGDDFGSVLAEMANIGALDIAWTVLDSQYFGVAQRRRRVFLVADFGGKRSEQILFESESLCRNPAEGRKTGEGTAAGVVPSLNASGRGVSRAGESRGQDPVVACLRSGGGVPSSRGEHLMAIPDIAMALTVRDCKGADSDTKEGHLIIQQVQWASGAGNCGVMKQGDKTAALNYATDPNQNIVQSNMLVRRLTPRECERLQGFPDDFTRYGIDNNRNKVEISDTQRYKMMGNAVTVSVPEWIGKRIIKHGES